MLPKFIKKQIANFLVFVLAFPFVFFTNSAYALYDGERDPVSWDQSAGKCSAGSLGSNPYENDKDILWDLSNPTCISFVALQGALIYTASKVVQAFCVPTNPLGLGKIAAETAANAVPDLPLINPITAYKLGVYSGFCMQRLLESSTAKTMLAGCGALTAPPAVVMCVNINTPIVAAAETDVTKCCPSVAAYAVAVGLGLAALAILFHVAEVTYKKARICGGKWHTWTKVNINGEEDGNGTIWRRGKYRGSYQKCIEDIFINGVNSCSLPDVDGVSAMKPTLRNKYYREYMYGGMEKRDEESASQCNNPRTWSGSKKLARLGYDDDHQRYYTRGSGYAANYACERFVMARAENPEDKAAVQEAYDCCKQRSQTTVCVENSLDEGTTAFGNMWEEDYNHKFCQVGEHCMIKTVAFDVYPAKRKVNYLCVKTFSLCPYNHLLGGGTEEEVFVSDENGQPTSNLKNYCQAMSHCVKVPVLPYVRISNLDGAFISSSCRDLKGDAQNVYGFDAGLFPIQNRGFSAPLVQCFKETMENLLLNKAGDTKCRNPDEAPDIYNSCRSGYFYKKGESLPTEQSFFVRIQDKIQWVLKMALTLSIAFFGGMILLGLQPVTKKQLLPYIAKIGLIMYFALGSAWQYEFVDGILGSSNYLADVMMRIDSDPDPKKQDGCQFPKFNYADQNEQTRYKNPSYPPRKEYLKIWDTLDCKFSRAIGFGPEVSVPNLVKMIIAGFLTGSLGLIFLVACFFYAFFLFSLILRGMHIFLMAIVAIVILIYVSPITITLSLFSRTKGIFEKWWKQILGLSLQPVILFAYLGIFISLFDKTMIGPVTFEGDGLSAPKTISCSSYRVCKSGMTCSVKDMEDPNKTDLINPDDSSIYCIFRIANMKTYSGLEALGIGLPVLTSLNSKKIDTIVKAAIIMFVFSQFMDKVSDLAAKLVGGAKLTSKTSSAAQLATKAYGISKAVQQRGARATQKVAPAAARAVKSSAAALARGVGNKGRSIANKVASGMRSAVSGGKKSQEPVASAKDNNSPKASTEKSDDKK